MSDADCRRRGHSRYKSASSGPCRSRPISKRTKSAGTSTRPRARRRVADCDPDQVGPLRDLYVGSLRPIYCVVRCSLVISSICSISFSCSRGPCNRAVPSSYRRIYVVTMMSSCHMPPPRFQRQAKSPALWAPATLSTVIYTLSIAVRRGLWSITGTEPGGICFAYFVSKMPNTLYSIRFDHRRGGIAMASRTQTEDTYAWKSTTSSLPPIPLYILLVVYAQRHSTRRTLASD